MTKRGIGFSILSALILLTAYATGFSEIFLTAILCVMVLTFALVSTLAGVFVLHTFYKVAPDSVERGQKVRIEMQFEGLLLLPAVVRVFLRLPEGKTYTCADLLFGINHTLTYDDFICPHRGLWQIGIYKIRCEDVFGFFSIPLLYSHKPPKAASLLVYPVLYELKSSPLPLAPSMEYSENNPATTDQGDSFSNTRLYRDGDPLKRIHWKMTIRTRELYTRQYEMSLEKIVVILLDTSACKRLPPASALGYADMASECGSAIAYHYITAGQTVKVVPTGNISKSILVRNTDEFAEAYKLFAFVSFEDTASLNDALPYLTSDLSRMSTLHVITNDPSHKILGTLSGFRSSQNQISVIFPCMNGSADEPTVTSDGIHIIPISHPRDIVERLGGIQ